MTKRRTIGVYAACLVAVMATACAGTHSVVQERADRARRSTGDILIAVAWPFSVSQDGARNGIEMAVEEVNAAGGVLGRDLRVAAWADDHGSAEEGSAVAQRIADNPDVVAVIGHGSSPVSIPASAIYQFAGILMMSPASTSPRLTRQEFDLVFSNIPSDEVIGRQMADFVYHQGYRQMVILAAKDAYGRGLANVVEGSGRIIIVDRQSYLDDSSFSQILENWKHLNFEAIFIAGSTPPAAEFIRQARAAGINVPIYGGDGLDSGELTTLGGEAAEGTVFASPFDPDDGRPEVQKFAAAFKSKYGGPPDAWAAQAYDEVKLLAYAMNQAGSTVPGDVARVLHQTRDWPGVTGTHTFDENGAVINKPIVLKVVRNGQFEFLGRTPSTP